MLFKILEKPLLSSFNQADNFVENQFDFFLRKLLFERKGKFIDVFKMGNFLTRT